MKQNKMLERTLTLEETLSKIDSYVSEYICESRKMNLTDILLRLMDMSRTYLTTTNGLRYETPQENKKLIVRRIEQLERLSALCKQFELY